MNAVMIIILPRSRSPLYMCTSIKQNPYGDVVHAEQDNTELCTYIHTHCMYTVFIRIIYISSVYIATSIIKKVSIVNTCIAVVFFL